MKVVLFCGGQGLRLREYSDNVPKPMVPIGYRPIIWHLMKYYAHYGHREFVLCLGYRGDVIKDYFLNYNECVSNDFVLSGGGKTVKLLGSDIDNWSITFVDTGFETNVGQRLCRVQEYLGKDEVFLANYADNLSDVPVPAVLKQLEQSQRAACFISVKPSQSFHIVRTEPGGDVSDIVGARDSDVWINGGFFAFRRRIFDYIKYGEELVLEPFQRMIRAKELTTHRHDGFWACMDTFKEKQILEDLYTRGQAPWEVWKTNGVARPIPTEAAKVVGAPVGEAGGAAQSGKVPA